MVNGQHAKLRSTSSKNGTSAGAASGGEGESSGRQGGSSSTTTAQVLQTLRKSLKAGSEWSEKDELLDVVYWGRQVIGAVMGIAWGLVPLYGIFGIILYVAITTAIVHIYVTVYQRQDEEQMGGFWELAKEGFGSSFATFLVCWILVYTGVHFDSIAASYS